jgi:DNA-directed RNA polymerase subunit RPC12/RpoP
MCHARPALLTVFSITQSNHSTTLLSSLDIADLEMAIQDKKTLLCDICNGKIFLTQRENVCKILKGFPAESKPSVMKW